MALAEEMLSADPVRTRRKRRARTFPYRVECSQGNGVLIVYATGPAAANIKIAARGWKRNPDRCLRHVVEADQKRTGVLELAT